MEWGDFLNQTAQDMVGQAAGTVARPSSPVSTNVASGDSYDEGQPAANSKPFDIRDYKLPLLISAGALVVLLVVMRMRR